MITLPGAYSSTPQSCTRLTYTAIFLLGIITLVFGIEMAMRALKTERFSPKGKWTTTICVGVISFLLLLTWMPTVAWPMYNRCFGSLIWFPMRYELLMMVLLVIMIGTFLFLAAIISIQLMRTTEVDPNQRIAASRMCYYLIMIAFLYVSSESVEHTNKNVLTGLTDIDTPSGSAGSPRRLQQYLCHFQDCRSRPLHVRPRDCIRSSLPPRKRYPPRHQAHERDELAVQAKAS